MPLLLIFILIGGQAPKFKAVFSPGGACVDGKGNICLVSGQEAVIYNSELKKIFAYAGGSYINVFIYGENLLLVDNHLRRSFVISDGEIIDELLDFFPRVFSGEKGRTFIFPPIVHEKEEGELSQEFFENYDRKILKEVTGNGESMIEVGDDFFVPTSGQTRAYMNYKGFFMFVGEKSLQLITETDPEVFFLNMDKGKVLKTVPLELEEFENGIEPEYLDPETVYPIEQARKIKLKAYFSNSRITNVFRFGSGFIVNYIGPGFPPPKHMMISRFDSEWNRIGDSQKIPGWLIGIHEGQGVIITFPDNSGNSNIRRVSFRN